MTNDKTEPKYMSIAEYANWLGNYKGRKMTVAAVYKAIAEKRLDVVLFGKVKMIKIN